MCGMCLPHCPTYTLSQHESESPRGRISLVKALLEHRLEAETGLIEHLDTCLGCMACQAMCPSQVAYGDIIAAAKALTFPQRQPVRAEQRVARWSLQPARMAALSRIARPLKLGQITEWLGHLVQAPALANQGFTLSQAHPKRFRPHYPSGQVRAPRVLLFTGCLGSVLDATSLQHSIQLLNRLGYDVEVPENPTCCGALHQHRGDQATSDRLLEENRNLFQAADVEQVLFVANGCGAFLQQHLAETPMRDVVSFLLDQLTQSPRQIRPLHKRVMIHESCSSRFKLNIAGQTRKLLEQIPDIELVDFNSGHLCCGAGGMHQISHPQISRQLANIKVEELKLAVPDILVSDNYACALNLKHQLRDQGIGVDIVHPVTLLASQLS